jgi:hypothetical protein
MLSLQTFVMHCLLGKVSSKYSPGTINTLLTFAARNVSAGDGSLLEFLALMELHV